MIRSTLRTTLAIGVLLGLLGAATAAPALSDTPVLKANVTVSSAIVTVGDMFTGAHMLAEEPLFRAPEPGTAGKVSLAAVRTAAARVGLTQFDNPGYLSVDVARSGTAITSQMLQNAVRDWLQQHNILGRDIEADINFDQPLNALYAANADQPLQLGDVRYQASNGLFSARFNIAGMSAPLTMSGRVEFMIEAPYLARTVAAGDILSAADIETRRVPLALARNGSLPDLAQLIGKQIKRPARAGMLLTDNLVTEPQLVSRNELITLIYKTGPITLTARGRALNAAAKGGDVSVLNMLSNKVITGTATAGGTVTIGLAAANS